MISEPEIKHVNALKIKKYRYKYAEFIAEGHKIIKELIACGLEVVHIFTVDKDLSETLPKARLVGDRQLSRITALVNPSDSLAVFKLPVPQKTISGKEWVVLLDDIQDPGNMGTIIRTCDWFGIRNIVCSDGCVDAFNPKVVQASMASVGRVNIWEDELEKLILSSQLPVYGAVLNGRNYHDQDFSKPGFILIGNEGHGIRAALLDKIDHPVTIPKKGQAESLNAAIATALILDKL